MSVITRDDWLQAMTDAGISREDDAEAITASEFAALMNMKTTTARVVLQRLVKAGKATQTQKRIIDSMQREMFVIAYRLETPCDAASSNA